MWYAPEMSQVKPSWRHEGKVSILGSKAKEEGGRRKETKRRRFIAGGS